MFRPDLVGNLMRLAGADRVLLGSDYPFDMGDPDPLRCVEGCAELDAAGRAMVTDGNARALFGPFGAGPILASSILASPAPPPARTPAP